MDNASAMNLTDDSNLAIVADSIAMVACNGGTNGAILVSANNGTEPYNYLWDTGDADSLLNNVGAGTYLLRVTDVNLCRRDTAFVISEPDALDNTFVFTQPIICHGDTEASFYAQISGGVAPYTYLWENSAGDNLGQTAALENMTADRYYLTVVDANNCIYEDSIDIVEPQNPLSISILITETQCTDSTGTATADVSGGVLPYTYNWYQLSNPATVLTGQGTNTLSALWVDMFVLEVTDALGCMAIDTFEMKDVSGIEITNIKILNHIWCPESSDGSAEVISATGGVQIAGNTLGYDVVWNDSIEFTPIADSLHLGTNTVRLIDALGCSAVQTVEITNRDVLSYSLDSTMMNFTQEDNGCIGSAALQPYGGDTSLIEKYYVNWFDASWNQIGTTDTLYTTDAWSRISEDLCEGIYYVELINNRSDGKTCSIIDSVNITRDTLNYTIADSLNVLCFGDNSGFIEIEAEGGSKKGYKYFWANENWNSYPAYDSTGNSLTNLVAGTYYLTIEDVDPRGGSLFDSIVITQPASKYLITLDMIEPGCFDSTGVVSVINPQGGVGPYTYYWLNLEGDTLSAGSSISNLWAAKFRLIVEDANRCYVDSIFTLNDNYDFRIDPRSTKAPLCFGDSIGSEITSGASDGFAPYTFNWFDTQSPIAFSQDSIIQDIPAGKYFLEAMDGSGCTRYDSVTLLDYPKVEFQLIDTVLNDCYTDNSGSITFSALGGPGNYQYWMIDSLGNADFQSNPTFTNLEVNKYELLVTSGTCESDTVPFVFISKSPQIIHEFILIDSALCNQNSSTGELQIDISAGYFGQDVDTLFFDPFIEYKWDGNSLDTTNILSDAYAGNHSVWVRTTYNAGDFISCFDEFEYNMPAKNNIISTTFVEQIVNDETIIYLDSNFYCPGEQLKLYTNSYLSENPGQLPDSIVWDSYEDILPYFKGDTLFFAGSESATLIPRIHYDDCSFADSIFVGRYVAAIDGDSSVAAGSEVKLLANSPQVSYVKDEDFTTSHSYTWTSDFAGATWLPAPPDTIAPTLIAGESGIITVYDTIKIINPSYSNQVCLVSDTLNLIVLSSVEASSGFTPNGDGWFDTWDISGINGWAEVDVQIFNRWGGLIWEHSGAYGGSNEWDGTNTKGNPVPSGTYYYVITYGNNQGVNKTLTGPVTILR